MNLEPWAICTLVQLSTNHNRTSTKKREERKIPLFRYSEPGSKCEALARTPSSADFLKSSIKHTIVRATVI